MFLNMYTIGVKKDRTCLPRSDPGAAYDDLKKESQ